jgi:hypothetical protein
MAPEAGLEPSAKRLTAFCLTNRPRFDPNFGMSAKLRWRFVWLGGKQLDFSPTPSRKSPRLSRCGSFDKTSLYIKIKTFPIA